VPGEPLEPSGIQPDEEPIAEQPTEVVPAVDLTEPLPETEGEPTEVMPPTGIEPTEVIAGGIVAADGTGEFTREHRRRVSHRRYVMRRIGVGLAALAIIGGAVWLLVVLLGDDDESAGGTDTTTPVTSEAAAIAPTTQTSTTPEAPATTGAAVVETTEAVAPTDPVTTAPEETEPTEPTDSGPASTGATDDTVIGSSPTGTVVYDLSSEPTCTIGQTLREGSTGPQVECVQERLNEITVGGTPLNADGVYGEQTTAAVRAFQEANELTPDGVVGPTTGGALGIWPE
jgi:peptidoglycan hydrolase-like protein with peptidoglycan-binding domain